VKEQNGGTRKCTQGGCAIVTTIGDIQGLVRRSQGMWGNKSRKVVFMLPGLGVGLAQEQVMLRDTMHM
jgi:hypothetical protein